MVVVRENSEGLYSGAGGFHRKGTEHEVAVQESINTRHGVERIVRYAFELAMRPDRRRKLTLVHKTNVLTFAGDLYQRVVNEVASEFPDVETDYVHVDACCIYFLDQPARFDVIVTDNMFGDIITDLGAMIQGGMGIAAGGNINPDGVSMFEPIGGTAPDHVGQGHDQPARRDRCRPDAARAARRGRARPRASRRASGSRAPRWSRCAPARWGIPPPRSATSWWSGRPHEPRSRPAARSSCTTPRSATARSRPACRTRSRTACGSSTRSTSSGCRSSRAAGRARTPATPSSSGSRRRRRSSTPR